MLPELPGKPDNVEMRYKPERALKHIASDVTFFGCHVTTQTREGIETFVWLQCLSPAKNGRLRKRYLREHKRVLYYTLLTSGKLYEHLAEIDTSARDMAEYLIKEMARKQGVTEELKARDMLRWVGKMNNIRACADEIVLNDIVYS